MLWSVTFLKKKKVLQIKDLKIYISIKYKLYNTNIK